MSRESNSDSGKLHATPLTKTQASTQYVMPPVTGAWAAPGHVHIPEEGPEAIEYNRGQRWSPKGDNGADADMDGDTD